MQQKYIDMTGKKIGHLKVLEIDKRPHNGTFAYWICKCDCGKIVSVRGSCLRSKPTGVKNHKTQYYCSPECPLKLTDNVNKILSKQDPKIDIWDICY